MMTPNVVVDVGNTRIKWGLCGAGGVVRTASLGDDPGEWDRQFAAWPIDEDAWVMAGVQPQRGRRLRDWLLARGRRVVVLDRAAMLPLRGLPRPPRARRHRPAPQRGRRQIEVAPRTGGRPRRCGVGGDGRLARRVAHVPGGLHLSGAGPHGRGAAPLHGPPAARRGRGSRAGAARQIDGPRDAGRPVPGGVRRHPRGRPPLRRERRPHRPRFSLPAGKRRCWPRRWRIPASWTVWPEQTLVGILRAAEALP